MTKIPVRSVWTGVVDYYYTAIQSHDSKYNIWQWIETEYNGLRQWRSTSGPPTDFFNYDFIFEDDADATAFKLKFITRKTT